MGETSNSTTRDGVWALALHGGAGETATSKNSPWREHMRDLLVKGGENLRRGASAIEVVHDCVRDLETSGFHLAGKGASPNAAGRWELDAAIMDGETRRAGAVAALEGVRHPIDVAQLVMTKSRHVLLAGEGACHFAKLHKCKKVKKPGEYYKPVLSAEPVLEEHGTVGAVALDRDGLLASATSTGGWPGKLHGRVGDTPLIGAGTWADERVAVSCTGVGEYFIRTSAASDLSARIRYGRQSVAQAGEGVMQDIGFLGGAGGLIAIDCLGRITMPFNTHNMKRGCIHVSGRLEVLEN